MALSEEDRELCRSLLIEYWFSDINVNLFRRKYNFTKAELDEAFEYQLALMKEDKDNPNLYPLFEKWYFYNNEILVGLKG